ncbi:MAG TPA: response regulator transcription factor [Terriglobales bacterium]|nr:response regulator transcription factor [Terriglobales bacterium]
MPRLRLFIADEQDVTRCVLSSLLTSRSGWEVCGEAADGGDAVRKIEQLKPDIALLDLDLPDKNGLEVAREILQNLASPKIIMLTSAETEADARSIFAAGAFGFVVKSRATQELAFAVKEVQRGRSVFGARIADMLLRERLGANRSNGSNATTEREREALKRLAGELAAPQRQKKPQNLAHPLRIYAVAVLAVLVAAAAAWLTYTDQWDRAWPAFHKLSMSLGLKPDAAPLDVGNPETKVWIDIHTGLYYCPGSDLYGKTSRGRYTKQRDAQMDHFEAAERKSCE